MLTGDNSKYWRPFPPAFSIDKDLAPDYRWRVSELIHLLFLHSRARIFDELASPDRGDGRATVQPQGFEPESYLNSTSQGLNTEDDQKDDHICGRSRQFIEYPGY